jgi:hypothetical protein
LDKQLDLKKMDEIWYWEYKRYVEGRLAQGSGGRNLKI